MRFNSHVPHFRIPVELEYDPKAYSSLSPEQVLLVHVLYSALHDLTLDSSYVPGTTGAQKRRAAKFRFEVQYKACAWILSLDDFGDPSCNHVTWEMVKDYLDLAPGFVEKVERLALDFLNGCPPSYRTYLHSRRQNRKCLFT